MDVASWLRSLGLEQYEAAFTQQVESTITVLNIGRMNDDVQQEAQRVDQDVPLATLDLLARVVARRIEPSPPSNATVRRRV